MTQRKNRHNGSPRETSQAPIRIHPSTNIYEIHIELLESDPSIWRRFAVRRDLTLAALHSVIQVVMGWKDSHLHAFVVGSVRYEEPGNDLGFAMEQETIDERTVRLGDVAEGQGSSFLYEYDFGDGWRHQLEVRNLGEPEAGVRYPVCLGGERACPPEDCGGIGGYDDLLNAISDPRHEDHDDLREWLAADFDPEAFDLEAVNRILTAHRWPD